MCLLVVALKLREDAPLVLAANRDEFYERPTAPAEFWNEAPDLLAGRDLNDFGTWLGVTRRGRLAALTNVRNPKAARRDAPSRGRIVSEYLTGSEPPEPFLDRLEARAPAYNGFNLILGDASGLWYFASPTGERRELPPGLYGLSNALLDTPWPKVERTKAALRERLAAPGLPSAEELLAVLADRRTAPDAELPDTGVGLELERALSAPFIVSPTYGTRSSTVLLIDGEGTVRFTERAFGEDAQPLGTRSFSLRIGER